MHHEPPPGHVFVGSLAEIDPRKVAEVVRGSRNIRLLLDRFNQLKPICQYIIIITTTTTTTTTSTKCEDLLTTSISPSR